MVRMGTVWDRTMEVLSGRGGALGRIAFLAIFLPTVVNAALSSYAKGSAAAPGLLLLGSVVSLLVLVALIWGQLALIALSTDPVTTPAAASALATKRLGPAIGIVALLVVAFMILMVPPVAVLIGSVGHFSPVLIRAGVMPDVPPGAALFFLLYLLAFGIFAIVVSARLAVLNAVIVNERLGIGAVRRAFALTRGSAWRIIGVLILYVIVLFVATVAAQSVVGLVFRLILGADAVATVVFLSGIAAAAVSAALTVVAATFVAQLYVATSGRRDDGRVAQTFE